MPFDREKAREVLPHAGFDVEGMLDRLAECVTDPTPHTVQLADPVVRGYLEGMQAAEARVAAVLALHRPHDTRRTDGYCEACTETYPCATAEACGVPE